MDRIEEIRERVEKLKASPTLQIAVGHVHPDYTYLLERIDELERENERLKSIVGALEAMKTPHNHLIPFDAVKAQLGFQRICEIARNEKLGLSEAYQQMYEVALKHMAELKHAKNEALTSQEERKG